MRGHPGLGGTMSPMASLYWSGATRFVLRFGASDKLGICFWAFVQHFARKARLCNLGGGKKREPLLHQKKLGVLRESGEYKGETIDIKIFDIKYANVKTKVFIWAFQRVSGMWTLGV